MLEAEQLSGAAPADGTWWFLIGSRLVKFKAFEHFPHAHMYTERNICGRVSVTCQTARVAGTKLVVCIKEIEKLTKMEIPKPVPSGTRSVWLTGTQESACL